MRFVQNWNFLWNLKLNKTATKVLSDGVPSVVSGNIVIGNEVVSGKVVNGDEVVSGKVVMGDEVVSGKAVVEDEGARVI